MPTTIEIGVPEVILVSNIETEIIEVGIQGPVGPPGPAGGEEEMKYANRTDWTADETVMYRGEAVAGSAESASVWRIMRRTFLNEEGDFKDEWADGNTNFDNVWDDHATTIVYS